MTDTKRTLLAGFLIALLVLLINPYLNFIGVENSSPVEKQLDSSDVLVQNNQEPQNNIPEPINKTIKNDAPSFLLSNNQQTIQIITSNFESVFSNFGGGSLVSFGFIASGPKHYQYKGGYNFGEYDDSIFVSLLQYDGAPENFVGCSPCVSDGEKPLGSHWDVVKYLKNNVEFVPGSTITLSDSDSLVVEMKYNNVIKKTTFYGNKYIVNHFIYGGGDELGLLWDQGLLPTERSLVDELTYSAAYVAQDTDIEDDLFFSPKSALDSAPIQNYPGKIDWVAIRNKYFIVSLVSNDAVGASLSSSVYQLNDENLFPKYTMHLNLKNKSSYSVGQYIGPLDVDYIEQSKTYLDHVMNFGWLPIQPFSRSVLWILKKLSLLGLNYGIILILFAFLIRLITGPLTKKSFQSSQKMQSVQPKLKKIQTKYKNDQQKLNKKMMELYKTEGVNPVGGCLPMLVQMPLLFSLFIVFRSTIEFRGAPFFGWINNLSQPDVMFNLGFNVPLYGSHVGFLPIVLGISMFLSQRLSMATMDSKQKPLMYFMSVFFFLLFNSFPSGLNLYYTVYNILNYFQQRKLKKA